MRLRLRWLRYFTPGPVSAWMGDRLCLKTTKPPRRRTRHRGLLHLRHPSEGGLDDYPAKTGELTGTSRDTLARIRGLAVWAGVWLRTSLTEISADVREAVAH